MKEECTLRMTEYGKVILLNGTPRSGKSTIATEIQQTFDGIWMNLGVDHFMAMTPENIQPGIGLRPGGERPDLEPMIKQMYQTLFGSIEQMSRSGLNVVVDIGIHDGYSQSLHILTDCVDILQSIPVWFVGVHCPIEVIMERRIHTWNAGYNADGSVPNPVQLWQKLVHIPGIYDVEVNTSVSSPSESAAKIREALRMKPTAFEKIKNHGVS